ncbi:MAG: hypothetical protein V3T70_03565 [Phycisphaerae bacterium]
MTDVKTKPPLPRWVRTIGLLTVVAAVLWSAGGWWLFREVGTITLARQLGEMMANDLEQRSRLELRPANVGRPTRNPLSVLMFSAPLPTTANSTNNPSANPKRTNWMSVAESTRHGWAAATSVCIGLLFGIGVAMWASVSRRPRFWNMIRSGALAVFPLAIFVLGMLCGRFMGSPVYADAENARSATGWWREVYTDVVVPLAQLDAAGRQAAGGGFTRLIGVPLIPLTQSRDEGAGLLLVVLATAAAAAAYAIRRRSHIHGPMVLAICASLAGTLVTLCAITMLIRYAHFPPLPTWLYMVATVLQSAIAWILLWAMLYLPHDLRTTAPSK